MAQLVSIEENNKHMNADCGSNDDSRYTRTDIFLVMIVVFAQGFQNNGISAVSTWFLVWMMKEYNEHAVIAGFQLSLLSIGCILDLLVNKQLSSTLQILRKNNDISSHTNSNNNVNKTVVQRYAFCILVDVAWYCLKCFGYRLCHAIAHVLLLTNTKQSIRCDSMTFHDFVTSTLNLRFSSRLQTRESFLKFRIAVNRNIRN